ncbi:MAG: 50S ribosomal protein L10 [Patescibacteria group bacterium]
MAKTREQKAAQLAELQTLIDQPAMVLTQYGGLTVHDLDELRAQLRAAGCRYRVPKTSLLKKVLVERGIELPDSLLKVQLGIATSASDEVDPNRVVVTFAKQHEQLKVIGAVINGRFVDESYVRSLAALPSRQELYAKLVGTVAAPLTGFVSVLGGNIRGLVSVLRQRKEQLA